MLTCGGAVALVTGAVAWVGVQAWQAKDELSAVVPLVDELSAAVSARDLDAAHDVAARFRVHADRAEGLTDGPLWFVSGAIPGIGANLAAVRTTSVQLSAVGESVLEPVLDVADSLGGTVDPSVLSDAREPLARAAASLTTARDAMRTVDAGAVLPPVAEGVIRMQSALEEATPVLEGLAQAGAVLPSMLGADGPREILVMLQNNAELRTGGGITGSFVQLHAEAGAISLVRQADSSRFPLRSAAIAPVPDAATALYGDVVGRFVQNATMTPDFSVSAQLASAWWQSQYGLAPDAVIAIDPLVLRALLAAHGPIPLADGAPLTADDLIERLLIHPYLNLDSDAQTAYLQRVTSLVLDALLVDIDPVSWAEALSPVIAEGRVSVWSAVPAEQAVLAGSAMGGPRARLDEAGDAAYAVYFNDATGGKMDTYLDVAIEAGVARCDPGGNEAVVRVTLSNAARAEGIPELPISMTGGGLFGTAVGDIGTNVTVAAPEGAAFGGVTAADGSVASANVVDAGRPSTAVRVNVSPGQTETVEFRFVLTDDAEQAPTILHTPLLEAVPVSALTDAACRT
jgi:hypothetical protein